ncbi:MAG: hypothetical protein KatS3mg131_0126 [Candidatus Tectimicrobiota bacterium]|nr:MAG: hypothetical protein KatS3mg131_0126 [Candidatus Tectomicrobia bacterium]
MDFARLSLPQVLDLERFARLAGALRACELGLELYDATGRVVVPLPKDAGPCGQAEGCPQARRELAAAVVRARAAQTQPCAPQGLLVGVPVQPFTTCLGALVACRPAAPAAVAAATVALLEQLLEQSVTVAVQQLEIENLASELLARYEQLTFLFDLGRFVNPADEPARVFDLVTRQLLRLYDASYVATVFHRGAIRQFAVAEGSQAQAALAAEAQRLCQHLAERVQACRRVIVLNDLRALAWEPPLRFTAVLAAPILVDEQCYGTLNLLATAPERPFLNGDIALLELVSKQVGIFLENHRLYERLAAFHQAQKMEALGRLAGGIAHDFNNILSAILGYGEMLRDDLPEGSGLRENAVRLLQAAERAKALVQQILSFSRQQKPARQRVSLVEVAQEALALLRPSLPETIALRHRFETAPATVLGDPTQLHQVLMNLCTNAVQAMREGGGVLEVGPGARRPRRRGGGSPGRAAGCLHLPGGQ